MKSSELGIRGSGIQRYLPPSLMQVDVLLGKEKKQDMGLISSVYICWLPNTICMYEAVSLFLFISL